MPKVGNDAGVQRWQSFDQQTVTAKKADGEAKVDHGASARENLKAAGQNIKDMFDPTNHFRDTRANSGNHVLSFGLEVLMIPWDLMGEVADVVTGPFKAAKNVGDAAVHGVMAGISRVFGQD